MHENQDQYLHNKRERTNHQNPVTLKTELDQQQTLPRLETMYTMDLAAEQDHSKAVGVQRIYSEFCPAGSKVC